MKIFVKGTVYSKFYLSTMFENLLRYFESPSMEDENWIFLPVSVSIYYLPEIGKEFNIDFISKQQNN